MKVAIVSDWIVNMGGAERVLLAVHELFPDAPVYSPIIDFSRLSDDLRKIKYHTSFLQKLPFACKKYQNYLPLVPLAMEQFDLSEYDVVISLSFSCAKGILTRPDTLHICYCHTPMRYAWNMYHFYMNAECNSLPKRLMASLIMNKLRLWDFAGAARVDHFIANSSAVAKRINKYYRRSCSIIPPPVDTDFFTPGNKNQGDYYLYVGRLTNYKRADLAVEAFNKLGLPLVVIGNCNERRNIQKFANNNIKFLSKCSEIELRDLYRRCKALIFPQEEDFGLVSLEAQACGKPVIAYRAGGALDTVIDRVTGIFFAEQKADVLADAVNEFESHRFDTTTIRQNALRFSKQIFKDRIKSFVEQLYGNSLVNNTGSLIDYFKFDWHTGRAQDFVEIDIEKKAA